MRRLLGALAVAAALWLAPQSADAAIALVSSSFGTTTSTTTITTTNSLAATAGDTQTCTIFASTSGASPTITPPTGFSQVDAGSAGSEGVKSYVSTSSLVAKPSFGFAASTSGSIVCHEWSGVNTTTPVDVHAVQDVVQSSAWTSQPTAVTPTNANNALVFTGTISGPNTVTTAPSGYTESPAGGIAGGTLPETMRAYYKLAVGTSSVQPSIVWGGQSGSNAVGGTYIVLVAAAGNLPIALIGTPSWANGTSTSPACAGLSASAGDTQVAYLWVDSSSTATITPPTGGTLVDRNDYTTGGITIATYTITGTLSAAPTFTLNASQTWTINCSEWSNVSGVDVHSASTGTLTGTNTETASALTPTLGQDAFIAGFGRTDVDGVSTAPAGYTQLATGNTRTTPTFSAHAYYLLNPPTSSQQPGLLWNNTGNYYAAAAYVVLKQTIVGGVGPITVTGQGLFGGRSATLTVADPGNTSTITATSGNTGIVTVSPASYASGTSGLTFTVTGVAPGTTTVAFTDTFGNSNTQLVTYSLSTQKQTLVIVRGTRGVGWPW